MVILRRTQKLAKALPLTGAASPQSDTALGDWYVNRLTVDRRPLLIFVSSKSYLPILLPARDVGRLPDRLPEVVNGRLRRLGIAPAIAHAEVGAMRPVTVAKTVDRRIVGIMVDYAFRAPYHLDQGAWDDTTLPFVEAQLAETPFHASKRDDLVIFPDRRAAELLLARWGSAP